DDHRHRPARDAQGSRPLLRRQESLIMVDLAHKTLLYDKLRFFITVAGVAFAVSLILVQVGLFIGILDNATITIEHLPADLWVTSKNTPNLDFVHQFAETNVERVRATPGVKRA